jgi:predicted  nucleic acid-binding Zn-ribbon protein
MQKQQQVEALGREIRQLQERAAALSQEMEKLDAS